MGRLRTFTRRSFLVGSAAIAGGVAFGTYAVRQPHANPLAQGLGSGEATFNPWVRISPDRITLITPHADIGQGAVSMQAALIAEEMDLEWGQFDTDFGQPSAAYYNTAMAAEAAPFLSTDHSFGAEATRSAMGAMFKMMGFQGTGGSSSVADSFNKLRAAGATARETLKLAASQRTGVAASELKTDGGAVLLPDGTRLPYTELAAEAAALDPVQDVPLRDPSQWRLVGKPMQRLDVVAKSTGAQLYGIDLKLDGMVHAAVRVSPRRSALVSHDATAAEGMRGVKKIVPVTNGIAVVADNTWRAMTALDQITFEWAPAPYPAEMDGHWAEVGASFTEERLDKEWRNEGDVAAGMDGDGVVEAEYRIPYLAHAPMEPMSVVVKLTEGRLDIWTGTQIPRFVKANMARLTGLDGDDIHVHVLMSGGSFGRRLEDDYIAQAVEIAMQMPDTPIKMIWQREEDFTHDFPRPLAIARGRGAVADAGIAAFDLSIAAPSVAESSLARLNQPAFGPTARQRWCPSALGGRSGRRATGSCTKASWTRCATQRVQTRCKSGCACAGTTHRARCWRRWARCRSGAAIWGRTGAGGWPLRWPLACPWPRWSRSPIPQTASVSTRCSSPPMWAACWTP